MKVWDREIRTHAQQRRVLWSIIQKYSGDPALISFVAALIRRNKIPGNDYAGIAKCLQSWVTAHIKFFREFPERFASPMRTLKWGIGDCDDRSILVGAALRGFRVPVKLRFVRYLQPQTNERKSHVYPLAKLNDKWVALETVRKVPFGFDPLEKLRKLGVKILAVEEIGDTNGT